MADCCLEADTVVTPMKEQASSEEERRKAVIKDGEHSIKDSDGIRAEGKTVLHRKPTAAPMECKVHLLPWYPAQAVPFMSVKTSNSLVSPAVGAETDTQLCVCVFFWGFLSINRYQRGFKLLYGDRGPSRCCMNHLVATAQLEMSRLISVPRASLLVRRLHLYLWH